GTAVLGYHGGAQDPSLQDGLTGGFTLLLVAMGQSLGRYNYGRVSAYDVAAQALPLPSVAHLWRKPRISTTTCHHPLCRDRFAPPQIPTKPYVASNSQNVDYR